jgi:phosphoenolpyruvate mutase
VAKKIVYIPMSADILHPGHLNVIRHGQTLGEVVIGLLTDEAIASKKRVPYMNYAQRFELISNVKGVDRVIPQNQSDYRPNLNKIKPDYVVHGDDWNQNARNQVLESLNKWHGKLIEVKYTDGISSTAIQKHLKNKSTSPIDRLNSLANALKVKKTLTALEAHNGLSALVVENMQYKNSIGKIEQFDAIWVSSLTDSYAKGKPDTEVVDLTSRLITVNEIIEVTAKPIIVDGDTGGHAEHFIHTVRTLERLGVSAIVIEDKKGIKRNSLHAKQTDNRQENIKVFANKIKSGINARSNDNFLIIARIESLILGNGQDDALNRAISYINAGASAIMIHSKDKTGKDIKQFAKAYNKLEHRIPLMVVPTSFNKLTQNELSNYGANIIVYANQLIRSAYPAMQNTALSILKNGRTLEAEKLCMPIEEFLKIVPDS